MAAEFHSIARWQQPHNFNKENTEGERNTKWVLALTVITMLAEIIAGTLYGSMALLADGWHMGTHAAAFMLTLFAYSYARKNAHNQRFTFGTGKVSVLGGFTSAVALGLVALVMIVESIVRLLSPEQIHFNQAILVAIIGLTVNLASMLLLKDHHGHHHGHEHHDHHHDDHNLKAAYFHVMADALTSLLAIGALLAGKYMGASWLDPMMGIVGAVIIGRWAWGLIRQTSPILLDASVAADYKQQLVARIEAENDHKVTDVHVWQVSADHCAAMISLVSHNPKDTDYYHDLLSDFEQIDHLTVEVNRCADCDKAHCPRNSCHGCAHYHEHQSEHHHHH
ncbi:CDF family Co(II)/Ni(II) efflux transporter DmeF [Shewanella sp. YIC-542]|uniref:CDF family Co(II)/Ni(II) efflux transporter DmeF n=1 Tax=Shewanella mytili TaxID=3377111 RepID=UPI00398E4F9E